MGEENFEFRYSISPESSNFWEFFMYIHLPCLERILNFDTLKCPRLSNFWLISFDILSPWLKKILYFDALKYLRLSHFDKFLSIFFYHGWRKFWIPIIRYILDLVWFGRLSVYIIIFHEENFVSRYSDMS